MSSDENCIEILEPDLCSICEDSNIVTIVICHLSPNGKHNGYYVCDECNKKWALRSNRCIICNEELNIETFSGYKFNFWKGVLGFNTFQDFKDFIGEDFIEKIKKRNKKLSDNINLNLVTYDEECTFMNKLSNSEEVISYFDEFNDNKASERIINYIENE